MDMTQYLETRKDITPQMRDQAKEATKERIEAYNLAQARKECHITQAQLAKAIGVGQSRVSELENGNLGAVRVDTIKKYVEGLGATLHIAVEWPDKTIRLT